MSSDNELYVINNSKGRTPFKIKSSDVQVLERDQSDWPLKVRVNVELEYSSFGEAVSKGSVEGSEFEEEFIKIDEETGEKKGFDTEKFKKYRQRFEETSMSFVLENRDDCHGNVFARKNYFGNHEIIVSDKGRGDFR